MKINKLVKDETNKIVNMDIELSFAEEAFFIGYALNELITTGFLKINEDKGIVEAQLQPKLYGDPVDYVDNHFGEVEYVKGIIPEEVFNEVVTETTDDHLGKAEVKGE